MAANTKSTYTIDCNFSGCPHWFEFQTVVDGRKQYVDHWNSTPSHGKAPVTQLRNEVSAAFRGETPGTADQVDGDSITEISIDQIDPNPYQTRGQISEDSITELVESIRHIGQRVAAEGRPSPEDPTRYQLAFGHRRLAALTFLAKSDPKFGKIRVAVRDLSNDEMIRSVAGENIGRKDLTPIESARAAQRLIEDPNVKLKKQEIAKAFGLSPSALSNRIRVLNSFTGPMVDYVDRGWATWNALRALFPLKTAGGTVLHDLAKSVLDSAVRTNKNNRPDPIGESHIHTAIKNRLSAQYASENRFAWPLDEKAREIDWAYRSEQEILEADYERLSPETVLDLTKQGLGKWGTNKKAWKDLVAQLEKENTPDRDELIGLAQHYVNQTLLPALRKNGKESPLGTLKTVFGILRADWGYDRRVLPDELRELLNNGLVMNIHGDKYATPIESLHNAGVFDPDDCNTCTTGRVVCAVEGMYNDVGQSTTKKDVRVIESCMNFDCAIRKLKKGRQARIDRVARLRKLEEKSVDTASKKVTESPVHAYRAGVGMILTHATKNWNEAVWPAIAERHEIDLGEDEYDGPDRAKLADWLNKLDEKELGSIVLEVLIDTQSNDSHDESYRSELPGWLEEFDLAKVPEELSAGKKSQ